MSYKIVIQPDKAFSVQSILSENKVIVRDLSLCQALNVADELNHLMMIVNILGEEDLCQAL